MEKRLGSLRASVGWGGRKGGAFRGVSAVRKRDRSAKKFGQLVARPAAHSATRRALSLSEMSSTLDMIDHRTPNGSRIEA